MIDDLLESRHFKNFVKSDLKKSAVENKIS